MSHIESFKKFLTNTKGYPVDAIRANTYKYDGKEYGRVEVISDGAIIQAFVLMSPEHVAQLEKFPFYRTYYQRNEYGYIVTPACNIASSDKSGKWNIHSANNLRVELTNPSFLNYDKAVERFRKRFGQMGNAELACIIKWRSISCLFIAFFYSATHLLSINGILNGVVIPLNETVISVFITMIVLFLVPPIIPYIKSLSYKDFGIELK